MIIVQPVGGNRRRYRTGLPEKSRGYPRTGRFESINTPNGAERSNRIRGSHRAELFGLFAQ